MPFFKLYPSRERISQLSFEGFREKKRVKITDIFKPLSLFIKAVFSYLVKRILFLFRFVFRSVFGLRNVVLGSKSFLVKKLIWSRGRLGRPIANLIVMAVALLVFMFGEVFNTSRFVVSQEINPDYLENVTDIIPQRNVATTLVPEDRKRSEPFTYVVQGGDTLSSIGERFRISTDALEYVNGLTDTSILKVGQELTIPPVSGLIHTVESGDTLSSIAEKYDVPPQAIADFNYILDTSRLAVGTELVIPGAKVPEPVFVPVVPSVPIPPAPAPLGGGWCIWPTQVRIITQYFAWYHNGVDIATPWSAGVPPLYACASGVVTRAGWDPWGLGLLVQINHGNGYETVYGHMSRIDVGYGQKVSQGQVIGIMGNTGRSTGPHVHFTIKYQGIPQNPLNYIQ